MKMIKKLWKLLAGVTSVRSLHLLILLFAAFISMNNGCGKSKEIPADDMTPVSATSATVPDWAPPETDPQVRFYFIPDMDIYYDAFARDYIFLDNGVWIYSASLPARFAERDLYHVNLVFLHPHEPHPWRENAFYVSTYHPGYFGVVEEKEGPVRKFFNENDGQFYVAHGKGGMVVHGTDHENGHPDMPGNQPGVIQGPVQHASGNNDKTAAPPYDQQHGKPANVFPQGGNGNTAKDHDLHPAGKKPPHDDN